MLARLLWHASDGLLQARVKALYSAVGGNLAFWYTVDALNQRRRLRNGRIGVPYWGGSQLTRTLRQTAARR
jgi:hypothetical protein